MEPLPCVTLCTSPNRCFMSSPRLLGRHNAGQHRDWRDSLPVILPSPSIHSSECSGTIALFARERAAHPSNARGAPTCAPVIGGGRGDPTMLRSRCGTDQRTLVCPLLVACKKPARPGGDRVKPTDRGCHPARVPDGSPYLTRSKLPWLLARYFRSPLVPKCD
jgi:hypothetical protein